MAPPTSVRFHYIKSNAFRIVHVDGVIGGPTPSNLIHASFFSERQAIPTVVEHELTPVSGEVSQLGKELSREAKDGFVREVEVGLMMNLDMAKKFHEWLGRHIQKLESEVAREGAADAS